jgi:hypothetical protein
MEVASWPEVVFFSALGLLLSGTLAASAAMLLAVFAESAFGSARAIWASLKGREGD